MNAFYTAITFSFMLSLLTACSSLPSEAEIKAQQQRHEQQRERAKEGFNDLNSEVQSY